MASNAEWPTPPTARAVNIRSDLEYMTAGERDLFRICRENGQITFFGVQQCRRCDAEVPRSKLYCSKEHHDEIGDDVLIGGAKRDSDPDDEGQTDA